MVANIQIILAILTASYGDTDFEILRTSGGTNLCCVDTPTYLLSTDTPDQACIPAESKCSWSCRKDRFCSGFNLKRNERLCEIYQNTANNFTVVDGCVHFSIQVGTYKV